MPDSVLIARTIQIMFKHGPSNSHTMCKVDIKKLNWKLQKLQNEGMTILGLYFEYRQREIVETTKTVEQTIKTTGESS